MECLDANSVQDLMSGSLSESERSLAIGHLDGCPDCRTLLGTLARDTARDVARETLANTAARLDELTTGGSQPPGSMGKSALAETALASRDSSQNVVDSAGGLTKLGRYTGLEKLGQGAMGVVYRADDPDLGRKVALKLLKRPDEELTERLVREARAMAKVSHPNVVQVYDVGVAGDSTYIAMELVEGVTLRAWGKQSHTVAEIVEAYAAAGRGLAAAHAAGIIHRDFKPDNCLVGADGRIRVTDFGLAAAQMSDGSPGSSMPDLALTSAGSVMGTPAYMAPEQFTGGNVDSRTDQFNFSVALYEALYGERPFAGKSFEQLGDNVCEGKVRPGPARTRVSRALRGIVLRGLAAKPGDRYPSMDLMLADLGRDRARAWRRTATVTALVGVALGLGLVADLAVRDRVAAQVRESFANTRRQTDRAFELLRNKFDAMSNLAYLSPATQAVSAHYDNADFGLGSADADNAELADLHQLLVSTDWVDFARKISPDVLAVADRKGRLLYTSAALDVWNKDLISVPGIQPLIGSSNNTAIMQLVRNDDPVLAQTRLLGAPHDGLSVMFVRTLAYQGSVNALYLQIADAESLLRDIRLDDRTLLALVSADGRHVGEAPGEVIAAAPADGSTAEVVVDGDTYLVRAQPVGDLPSARVVMAREIDSVLALFPHARVVFALAMFVAFMTASGCAFRARQIAGA
nr:protein kinase [Kofleriaceae bacterium]